MRKLNLIIFLSTAFLTSAQSAEVKLLYTESDTSDTVITLLPDLEVKSRETSHVITSAVPLREIDAEKIRTAAITDISDAVRRLPGVTLRDYGGSGGMKTLSVRGLGSEHTAVSYDGIVLSDCQNGQIDLSRYSLDNIESLSLYAGDNDDIFIPARAAASSSSLSISTFSPKAGETKGINGNIGMKGGEYGFYNPYFRMDYSNGRGIAVYLNGEYLHSDNNYPFTLKNGSTYTKERRSHADMNAWHVETGMLYKRGGGSWSGKIYYYDNDRNLPGPVIYYVGNGTETMRDRNFFGQFQFKGRLSSTISLLANAKYNLADARYQDYQDIYPGGLLENHYLQQEGYLSGSLLFQPKEGFSFDYSADWILNSLNSFEEEGIKPIRNSILQTLAMKYLWNRLAVTARALYSIYINRTERGEKAKDATRLSPSVSLSYRLTTTEDLFLRASYKNIFRMPTFNELYYRHYGSLNLDPETTEQFNLGITYSGSSNGIMKEISTTIDGYANFVRNKIVAVPYNMFIWRMSNLGKVRVFGLDVTLSATMELNDKNSIVVDGSYSYQRAQPRTSKNSSDWMKQVAYIPWNSGAFSLSWLNQLANIALHSTATGKRYTMSNNLPETKMDGYIEFGVGVFRNFAVGKYLIEGRADLLNIFNRQYEIVARYPMPGRSWRISLNFKF